MSDLRGKVFKGPEEPRAALPHGKVHLLGEEGSAQVTMGRYLGRSFFLCIKKHLMGFF